MRLRMTSHSTFACPSIATPKICPPPPLPASGHFLASIPPALAPLSLAISDTASHAAVVWTRLFGKPPTAWTRTVCSAVTAVIGVNGVLVAFLLAAFGEKTAEEVAKKED